MSSSSSSSSSRSSSSSSSSGVPRSDISHVDYNDSQDNPSYQAKAWDDITNDGNATGSWYCYHTSAYQTTGYVGQDFGASNWKVVDAYSILAVGSQTYDPKSWTFKGSNNGTDWTTLDTQTNQSFGSTWRTFNFTNSNPYRYYRLDVTENNGHGTYLIIKEVELYGEDGSFSSSSSSTSESSSSESSSSSSLSFAVTEDGLYLEGDTDPYTSTTMNTGMSALIDEVLTTQASVNLWYYDYSYGIDLGESKEIDGLVVHTIHGGGDLSAWYSTGHDSVQVFKSSDNSTWTAVQTFDGPTIDYHSSGYAGFTLAFSSSQTARYFKVVNIESSSTLAVTGGASVKVSEIEIYEASVSSSSSSRSSSSSSESSSSSSESSSSSSRSSSSSSSRSSSSSSSESSSSSSSSSRSSSSSSSRSSSSSSRSSSSSSSRSSSSSSKSESSLSQSSSSSSRSSFSSSSSSESSSSRSSSSRSSSSRSSSSSSVSVYLYVADITLVVDVSSSSSTSS